MFFHTDRLRAFGARPCLVLPDGRTVTYENLAESVGRFGTRLPKEKRLVAIEAAADPAAISAHLGAMAAGHPVLPLPADDAATADHLVGRFRPAVTYRRQGGAWKLRQHHGVTTPPHPDLALLLTTSGSTGQGKGVRLSNNAVVSNAGAIANFLRIGVSDRAALILPLHYSYGLSVLHSHLAHGASLWLAGASVLDEDFADALEASGATSLAGVPHHFRLLESTGLAERLPSDLRLLTVAGGAMEPGQVRRWTGRMAERDGRFIVMYGQTEATARIAWLPMERGQSHPDAIGSAIPGGHLSLRDAAGTEIETPVAEGELIYRGPNVMMGYAEDHHDLHRGPDIAALATGDLARRDAEGLYWITGRLARMSKIAGLRIGHDALERALGADEIDAAVWGDDRKILIATRSPEPDVIERAARHAGIARSHFEVLRCAEFPRLPSGKIDYPALRRLAPEAPQSSTALTTFAAAFAPQPVRGEDSFDSLGGDSLRHVALSLALEDQLGGLPDGWERMSIAALDTAPIAPSGVTIDLLVRGLAILAVVVSHQTHWPIFGGAAAMVMLLGMSLAAYRWDALCQGNWKAYFTPALGVLLPYYAILAAYAAVWGQVPWVSVVLAGNFALTIPETHAMLPYLYWFVEAYIQMTVLLALPFAFPALRRTLAQAGRFRVGVCLFAIAVLLRIAVPLIWPIGVRAQFTVPWVFFLLALGWCIASAESVRQKIVVLLLAAAILPLAARLGGNWHGSWIKYMMLLALVPVLLHLPRVRLPRPVVRPVLLLARAAFPIYLLHRLVPEVIFPALGIQASSILGNAVAITAGIGLGLIVAELYERTGPSRHIGPPLQGNCFTPIHRGPRAVCGQVRGGDTACSAVARPGLGGRGERWRSPCSPR